MSDPRVEEIKKALIANQSGSGLDDIRVYMGPSRQYGQGFNDFVRNIIHTAAPIVMRIAKTCFKTSSDSLKEGSSLGDSFKAAIKPTLRTALKHGGRALGKIIQDQDGPATAPPVEAPLLHQNERDVGTERPQTGAGRYKASRKRKLKQRFISIKRPNVHYNF